MNDRVADIRVKLSMSTGDTADDIAFLLDERDLLRAELAALLTATEFPVSWTRKEGEPEPTTGTVVLARLNPLLAAVEEAREVLARGEIGVEGPSEEPE